jgi:hypothetical protein
MDLKEIQKTLISFFKKCSSCDSKERNKFILSFCKLQQFYFCNSSQYSAARLV